METETDGEAASRRLVTMLAAAAAPPPVLPQPPPGVMTCASSSSSSRRRLGGGHQQKERERRCGAEDRVSDRERQRVCRWGRRLEGRFDKHAFRARRLDEKYESRPVLTLRRRACRSR